MGDPPRLTPLTDPQPAITRAVVHIELADGRTIDYTIHACQDMAVHSDRDYRALDMTTGTDPPEIPRPFPIQIAFAFTLPLTGTNPVSLDINQPGSRQHRTGPAAPS
jgi:hypothetical protein